MEISAEPMSAADEANCSPSFPKVPEIGVAQANKTT